VETDREFHAALDLGYSYFQGYFSANPVIRQPRDPALRLNLLRIKEKPD
jgi:c-di-GMP-related signal transduction protein